MKAATLGERLPAHIYNVWWNIYAGKTMDIKNCRSERDRILREVR